MTNLIFRVNTTVNDENYAGHPGDYVDVDNADSLIFSAGSVTVADGEPIPTQTDLNRAATLLDPDDATIVVHYFLADNSAGILKEIHLAGNQDKQYVFCCSFDGATTSEPQLEAWDDTSLATAYLLCLGAGQPSASWYKAKCTTSVSPGSSWTGTPLAGDGASYTVKLNAGLGALVIAKDLYFNFHVKILAGVSIPGVYLPILAIVYTSN